MNSHVVNIQKHWRSFVSRKRVRIFSRLPDELWSLVLCNLRKKPRIYELVDNFVNNRLDFISNVSFMREKTYIMHTLTIIRKYSHVLCEKTLQNVYSQCVKLMLQTRFLYQESLLVNATLEHISTKKCSNDNDEIRTRECCTQQISSLSP